MTADNVIDAVAIDGTDIMSQVQGGPPNYFGIVYSADITSYLKSGLTHTLTITAHNVAIPGQNSVQNPAMLIYEIISRPDCSGNSLACGDGIKTQDEQCDGADLGDKTDCKSLGGYDIGSLSCNSGCLLDTSQCRVCSITVTGKAIDGQTGKGIAG
jgi:hypothetical protein